MDMVSLFLFRRRIYLDILELKIDKDLKKRLVLNYFVVDRVHGFKFNGFHDNHGSIRYWFIR
jgi:hypothetical protein